VELTLGELSPKSYPMVTELAEGFIFRFRELGYGFVARVLGLGFGF